MTVHNVFMKNKLFLRHMSKFTQLPPEIYSPSKLRLGQAISVTDPFELYQAISFGIPTPVYKFISNPFNQNWSDTNIQILNLSSTQYLQPDGTYKNDLFIDHTGVSKLRDVAFVEDSPRGPHLEILMNYLERLATFHGIDMPKFQMYKEEHSPVDSEDLNPVGGSSFDHVLTVNDLPTFRLYGRIWYIQKYITQIQDWLDLFATKLGHTKGSQMFSWIPMTTLVSNSDYSAQKYNLAFKEGIEDPNMRGSSWTPKDKSTIGKYGKLYRNEHHRVFPNDMRIAQFPNAFYLEGGMFPSAFYAGPYAIDYRLPEDVPPPRAQNTFGGFIKGDDGQFYLHLVDPFAFQQYKYHVPNIPMRPETSAIYPTNQTSYVPAGSIGYGWQYGPQPLSVIPQGTQGCGTNGKLITHRIFIYRTDGALKRRYGITSSNPKCLFYYGTRTNTGTYFVAPTVPGTRPLTASCRAWGRLPYKRMKITCGVLNDKYGFYSPSFPLFDLHVPPPDPFKWHHPGGTGPTSFQYIPYLQSHMDILEDVAGQIDAESNNLLSEFNTADMEFDSFGISGGINFGDPLFVNDHQQIEQVLDMSPIFSQSGDFAYVCISYHDFFQEVNAFTSYELMDLFNAYGASPANNGDPGRYQQQAFSSSMSMSWAEGLFFPFPPPPYPQSSAAYLTYKIAQGEMPPGTYWNAGNSIDIASKNPLIDGFNMPQLPILVNGPVYR